MGTNTRIQWTDATLNPWEGCTKVSPGCDNCYAASWNHRMGRSNWGPGAERKKNGPGVWREIRKLDKQAVRLGVTKRVFVASMADVFDGEVPQAWRDELWQFIASTRALEFQLLTKRPGNVLGMLPSALALSGKVWVGASIENQEWFWNRLPALAAIRQAYKFMTIFASYEPALGPVDFSVGIGKVPFPFPNDRDRVGFNITPRILDWIIVGGESGHHARPFDPAWAERVIQDARGTGCAVFVKQMGAVWGHQNPTSDRAHAGQVEDWPEALRVRQFPPR